MPNILPRAVIIS